nr:hypothetical protein [Ruegeria arenilitoris]
MADLGFCTKSPAAHYLVMQIGPHLRGAFHGVLAGKAKSASGPAAPASLLLHIEEHEMCMGISCVIALLVVDGRNIPGNALGQSFGKGPR